MNSAVITKIEYRIFPDAEFTLLTHIMYSGKLNEESADAEGVNLFTSTLNFSVAKITASTDSEIKSVKNRQAQFRVTDGNGTVYLVGDESYPARLVAQSALDGSPGSFNGYRCTVTCRAPYGCLVQDGI